jgi:hypothetical protein
MANVDLDRLVEELKNVELPFLYTGERLNEEKCQKALKKIGAANDKVLSVLVGDSVVSPEGIAIIEGGVKFSLFSGSSGNMKFPKIKGEFSFEELRNRTVSIEKKMLPSGFKVTMKKRDIEDGKNLTFRFNLNEEDLKIDDVMIENLRKFFDIITQKEQQANDVIADEKNAEIIDAYIWGDEDDFYKKAFGKYSVNGIDRFAFVFSFAGFLLGGINLFHRKIYLGGLIAIVISFLFGFIGLLPVSIGLWFIMAFVNPFLVYKRFRKHLSACQNANMDRTKKLETLTEVGGTNAATTLLAGIIALGFIVFLVISFVRGCM